MIFHFIRTINIKSTNINNLIEYSVLKLLKKVR